MRDAHDLGLGPVLLEIQNMSHVRAPPRVDRLIIVADDLGVDYVGVYGEGSAPPPTPNIDGLAGRGVLFRNAWANPSCSPTRACINTGRYPFRTLVGRWIRHLNNSEPIGTLQEREWTLPEVLDSAADFGTTSEDAVGAAIPVCGIAGDQQAALIGQAGFEYGMTKSTYGTGCFVIANTGGSALTSRNQLLTTIASRIGGEVTYGLEGSVFVAGSALQWLRDELRIIDAAPDSEQVAERTGIVNDVFVVPAFAGLGAPYWDPDARGAIVGLSRGSGRDQIVTATLQAVAYQTRDLIDAMADDGISPSVIRVDGGMVANDWFLQFLADILGVPVERPANVESTVLGAAYLAAFQCGLIDDLQEASRLWQCDAVFEPRMAADQRDALLSGWAAAVARVRA